MHIILSSLDPDLASTVEQVAHRYVDFIDRFEMVDELLNAPDLPVSLSSLLEAVSNGAQAVWNIEATLGIAVVEGIISVKNDGKETAYFTVACGIFDGEDVHTGLGRGILLPNVIAELFLRKGYSKAQVQEVFPTLYPGNASAGEEHLVFQLTRGLMNRGLFVESALESAFITYMNRDRFQ